MKVPVVPFSLDEWPDPEGCIQTIIAYQFDELH